MLDLDNIENFFEQIITYDGKPLDRHVVIKSDDFQMSTLNPKKIFRFKIFLLIDNVPVPRSDLAVHMATPADGVFVLYELKDMKVAWEKINGCRIVTFDIKGNVEVETVLKFYGIRRKPRRCVLMENDNLSRAIVIWHMKKHTEEEIQAENKLTAKKVMNIRKVVEKEEEDNVGVTILPPASFQEKSSVSDILRRIRSDEDIEPHLPF